MGEKNAWAEQKSHCPHLAMQPGELSKGITRRRAVFNGFRRFVLPTLENTLGFYFLDPGPSSTGVGCRL